MNSNELRIGNLVYSDIGVLKVSELMEDGLSRYKIMAWHINGCYGKSDDGIKPLGLTKEWLLELGLITKKGNYTDIFFTIKYNFADFSCLGQFYKITLNTGLEILYVHQLQNIYFALTEKELKI